MDGLIKIILILIILYGMGKLGPRTRRRMERMGSRLRELFCGGETGLDKKEGGPVSR